MFGTVFLLAIVASAQAGPEQAQGQPPIIVVLEECENSVHLTMTELGRPAVDIQGRNGRTVQLNEGTLYVAFPKYRPFHFLLKAATMADPEIVLRVEDHCLQHVGQLCNVAELHTRRNVELENMREATLLPFEESTPEEEERTPQSFAEADEIPLNLPTWRKAERESLLDPNPFLGTDGPEGIGTILKREFLRALTRVVLRIPIEQPEVIEATVIPSSGVILGPEILLLEEPAWRPVPKKPEPRRPSARAVRGIYCQK